MNKDIVVLVNEVVGSVLSICSSIKKRYKVKTYVICINSNYKSIFQCSKYVDNVFQIYASNSLSLLQQMKNWYADQNFRIQPILYFTDDHNCNLVNDNREWYEMHFDICLPSSFIVKSFTLKGVAEKIAKENGLQVPKSKIVINNEDINEIFEHFSFPVIIKPRSTEDKDSLPFKKTKILTKESFLDYTYNIVNNKKTFLCQEYIPGGDEKSIFYLFYRSPYGEITECIGRKVLQSPPQRGIMAIGQTSYNQDISNISRSFLDKINYVGIGGIEFKENNGIFYFIEMSTRAEGFTYISDISGVSVAEYSYKTYIKEQYFTKRQKDNVFYVDLVPFIKARLKEKNVFSFFVELIKISFSPLYKFNILNWNDPLPFLINVAVVFNNKVLHRKK